jgi:hypothetical protein
MKVAEILFEIKLGKPLGNPKEQPKYWAIFSKDTLYTYPNYGHGHYSDLRTYFNNGEYPDWHTDPSASAEENAAKSEKIKAANNAANEYLQISYSHKPGTGYVEVDNVKKIVNLDTSKSTNQQNRRPNSKIDNFNSKAKDAYPILQGEPGVERVMEVVKIFKMLVRFDERTIDYEVIGDDRFHGYTVGTVISEPPELKKQLHTRLISDRSQEVTLYHGTSIKRAKIILKTGLNPGIRTKAYGDMVKNYSENNVYVSLNPATAANYATREAINDGSDPTILKINLKGLQINRAIPDEDSMHWLIRSVPKEYYKSFMQKNPILGDIWGHEYGAFDQHFKNFNHEDQKFNLMWIFYQGNDEMIAKGKAAFEKYGLDAGYKSAGKVGSSLQNPTDPKVVELEKKIYRDLISTFVDGAYHSSVKNLGNVAYPGKIPASQIEIFKTWSIKGTKISSEKATGKEYNDAYDAQAATVKRPVKK